MTRDENQPIAKISHDGRGTAKAGDAAMLLLVDQSPLMIVAADGDIYAIDPNGKRATKVAVKRPGWIVGTYTRRCGKGVIAADLVEHARQARQAA